MKVYVTVENRAQRRFLVERLHPLDVKVLSKKARAEDTNKRRMEIARACIPKWFRDEHVNLADEIASRFVLVMLEMEDREARRRKPREMDVDELVDAVESALRAEVKSK